MLIAASEDMIMYYFIFSSKKPGLIFCLGPIPCAIDGDHAIMTGCAVIVLRRRFEIISNISAQ